MKLIFYDFDIFWFSQCYNILPNKKWIAVFKSLFFSTLTVYTYFKVFSIDNRDFFLQFPRHLQHLYHIRFILNRRFSDLWIFKNLLSTLPMPRIPLSNICFRMQGINLKITVQFVLCLNQKSLRRKMKQ